MAKTTLLWICFYAIFVLFGYARGQASCATPTSVANAQIMSVSPYGHGSLVTYQCNNGYSMTGSPSNVQCSNGAWTGSYPVCNANCAVPTWIAYTTVLTSLPYEHGDDVTYQCYSGYSMFNGGPSLQCDDGSWVGTFPVCYADCPNPTAPSFGDILTSSPYAHGDSVTYQCWPGWTMGGQATSQCSNGAFSNSAPVCYFNCSDIVPIGVANAWIITSLPYMHDDLMTYRCIPGFSMSGQPSQRCFNGTWTGSLPSCDFIVRETVTEQTLTIYTPLTTAEEERERDFMYLMWAITGGFFFIMAVILSVGIFVMVTRMRCCERIPEPEPEKVEEPEREPRLAERVLAERYVPKPLNHDNVWRPFGKNAIQERQVNT